MRSRDWSSAVCSPDLVRRGPGAATRHRRLDWPARDPVAAFLPLSAVHRHAGRPADLCRTARAGAALTQSHHPRTPMSTETADPRYTDLARWPTRSAVDEMIEGQLTAIAALQPGAQALADEADAAAEPLPGGGRPCITGRGSSGRAEVQ